MGFRFTTERIARRFPVTGYVKNLSDGKVELVAEGEEASLKEILAAVREAFHAHVRDVQTAWSESGGEFKTFGVKF